MEVDDRFSAWLQRLEKSLQLYKDHESLNETTSEPQSLKLLSSAVSEEDYTPDWANQFNDDFDEVVGTKPNELKSKLCRLGFPKISLIYEPLKSEVSSLSTAAKPIQYEPIEVGRNSEKIVEEYFNNINSKSLDPVVGLCKLADYSRRVDRISNMDQIYLQKLISREKTKFDTSSTDQIIRLEKLTYLEGKDGEQLIKSSANVLNGALQSQKDILSEAMKQEELARLAYEEAMKRTKSVQHHVNKLEDVLSTIEVQTETTKKINEMQLLIDNYNLDCAKRRLDLLGAIQSDLHSTQQIFFDRCFKSEFPLLLKHVTDIFSLLTENTKAETNIVDCMEIGAAAGAPMSAAYALRIGIEAMKVFRTIKRGVVFDVLDEHIQQFDAYLKGLLFHLASTISPSNPRFKLDNTTVVLSFSHLYHDTPEDHVEAQSRINTSLKLMERQFAQNEFSSQGQRAIVFQNCNDIVGPPLWCLPLVHSPQYLNRLWNYSVEAKTDDLYVPLEFDTEWETDEGNETESSDSEESFADKRLRSNGFELDENLSQTLGSGACERLTKIFRQDKLEKKLSKYVSDKRQDGQQRRRRRSRAPRNTCSNIATSTRVSTPYGNGIIVENENGSNAIKVKFDWGAVGYMNKESVQEEVDASELFSPLRSQSEKDKDNERFMHTDLRLHKLVARIIAHVKVQRSVLENVGVKDAHMSLWLHGRTSRGLSQSIEKSIKDWLRLYDVEKLKALLDEFDAKSSSFADDNVQFMNRLQSIKHPFPSLNRVSLFNENESVDFAALRSEAFVYSKKRLLNKSGQPRANHPRKNRAGKPKTERKMEIKFEPSPDVANTNNLSMFHLDGQRLLSEQTQSQKKLIIHRRRSSSHGSDLVFSTEQQQTLRTLVLKVMNAANVTQTVIASELQRIYQYKTSQSAISAWFRFRSSKDSERELGKYFTRWIHRFRKALNSMEREKLNELETYINSKLSPSEREQAIASSETVHMTSSLNDSFEISTPQASIPSHTLLEGLGASFTTDASNDNSSAMMGVSQFETERFVADMEEDIAAETNNNAGGEDEVDNEQDVDEEQSDNEGKEVSKQRGDEMDLESVEDSVKEEEDEEEEDGDEDDNPNNELQDISEKLSKEISRRNLSQSFISKEAKRISIHISQQEISFFVLHKVIPYSQRNRDFIAKLSKWIAHSEVQIVIPAKLAGETSKVSRKRKRFEDTVVDEHIQNLANAMETILDKPHFNSMSKYQFCELCKEEDDLIPCSTCPCQYHANCMEDEIGREMLTWHCNNCEENGAATAKELTTDEKQEYCRVVGAALFYFSSKQHVWIKCTVVAVHPELETVILVKSVSDDDEEEGKTSDDVYQWIDYSKLRLLKSNALASTDKDNEDDEGDELELAGTQESFVRDSSNRSKRSRRSSPTLEDMQDSNKRRGRPPARRDPEAKSTTATNANIGEGMSDTYLGANSLKAALCAAGTSCRAVDIAMSSIGTNVFCAIRPPGHHAGRNGCTIGCNSTGFCLLNNAAIAVTYARVRWGIEKIAVVDIDVHFGNGTAEILQHDPDTFFASVHMIYGEKNDGHFGVESNKEFGFYPANQGVTDVTDSYVSIGVFPPTKGSSKQGKLRFNDNSDADSLSSDIPSIGDDEQMQTDEVDLSANKFVGSKGYLNAIQNVILPKMEAFAPQLLIISAGFDGYFSDPLGGELNLSLDDYLACTKMLMNSMNRIAEKANDPAGARVISLLEGGYDTSSASLGLARCVAAHVSALRQKAVS